MENLTKQSKSEKHGLDLITDKDLKILSIGISTAGSAEIEMTKINENNHIIATSIDLKGIEYTRKIIDSKGLGNRIELKLEDVSKKMPYYDNYFDFIYARLVLHYLKNSDLKNALSEIYRVLKNNCKLYVVVRSIDDWETKQEGTTYDEETGFTRYPKTRILGNSQIKYLERRLHSKESITQFLTQAGFEIEYIEEYCEDVYLDYERTIKKEKPIKLIEVCAIKP